MAAGSPQAGPGDLERLRREYETSLSWRLTRPLRAARRPLRAAGRLTHGLRSADQGPADPFPPTPGDRLDSWLSELYGDRLQAIDGALAAGTAAEPYALFRELDDDLWAMLLTQQYDLYPHIRALLPEMPEPALQELWNGLSGLALAAHGRTFYSRLRRSFESHAGTPLADASVLDFGCGWGRLTRLLARDVAPGRLCGCDPVEGILDACRRARVPARLARSEFRPDRLPFTDRFDLAYAFSVFTHLSEPAHEQCLAALHRSLAPDGILIVTVRPPAYLRFCPAMHPLLELGDPAASGPRYLFVAHPALPEHPQYDGRGELDYGEAVIPLAYVRARWSRLFELLDVQLLLDDPYQVMLTLRRV